MAPSGETRREAVATASAWGERRKELMEKPPDDDVCPICFGDFEVPCRASCGHWFCGGCIMKYWSFTSALRPCKCPMCMQPITNLVPQASLCHSHDAEISKVLREVVDYNRSFSGGIGGFILKLNNFALYLMKKVLHSLLSPDRPLRNLNTFRTISMVLWMLYSMLPFDFARIDERKIPTLANYSALVLSTVFLLIGLYLRWRRVRNVRLLFGNMAAAHG